MFVISECSTVFDTCIFDHYPICVQLDNMDRKRGNKWNHIDPKMLPLPIVYNKVKRIWNHFFNIGIMPAKAWSLAVNSIQPLLICSRKGLQKIREEKKERYKKEVGEFGKEVDRGEINAQKELRYIRNKLIKMANREMEDSALYFREWWAGKADRPSYEMFKMLKVKHVANFILLMKDKSRIQVGSKEDNKRYIAQHFHSLLFDHPHQEMMLKRDLQIL